MSVTAADFAAALMPLWPPGARAVAVAVSGGADSLALTLLAAEWAQTAGVALTALTVDHRLRPDSAAEAAQVAAWLAARNIPHRILVRRGDSPSGNLQATARKARYDLLTQWCRAAGVPVLLLGHHREDQIETFLLRLGRGSGLRGLAGMRGVVERDGVMLVRPLLNLPRDALRATLTAAHQPWIDDPSNTDARFRRTAMRDVLPQLTAVGITPQRLHLAIRNLQRAATAVDAAVAARIESHCMLHDAGYATLGYAALLPPDELALRSLADVVQMVGGQDYTGRLDGLTALLAALRQSPSVRRTRGGCLVSRDREAATIAVWREPAAVAAAAPVGDGMLWDNRFRIGWGGDGAGCLIGALGEKGWAQVRSHLAAACRLPHPVRLTLPALWQGGRVVAVPHLDWAESGWEGRVRAVFAPPHHPAIFKGSELTYI